MTRKTITLATALLATAGAASAFPAFEEHTINPEAGTGLAITVADVNNDGKPDIVGVSADDVAWYENPSWERHRIADTIRNSNVCVDAYDIDGDGVPELALGADWQFNNTESGGALFLLSHEGDVTQPWKVTTLVDEEPTLHRIRWADLDGNGKKELVVAPLKGFQSTGPEFMDAAVHLYALFPGDSPLDTPWRKESISVELHLVHNIWPAPQAPGLPDQTLIASAEGVYAYYRAAQDDYRVSFSGGLRYLPQGDVGKDGAGEIKTVLSGTTFPKIEPVLLMATIEPWHGHQAVVYTPSEKPFHHNRFVLDDQLKGGHAIWFADFDRDGVQDLLVGFREKAGPKDLPGLNIYELHFDFRNNITNDKHVIDDGGMATEDALASDMNGDGWPDVVAFGRATHNIKYYENLGIPDAGLVRSPASAGDAPN